MTSSLPAYVTTCLRKSNRYPDRTFITHSLDLAIVTLAMASTLRSLPLIRPRWNLRPQDIKLRRGLWGLSRQKDQKDKDADMPQSAEVSNSPGTGRKHLTQEQQNFLDSAVS